MKLNRMTEVSWLNLTLIVPLDGGRLSKRKTYWLWYFKVKLMLGYLIIYMSRHSNAMLRWDTYLSMAYPSAVTVF